MAVAFAGVDTGYEAARGLLRGKPGEVRLVNVPELSYLMVDGKGSPQGQDFQEALQALFTLSYGAKFGLKKRGIATPRMLPLEALWDGVIDWEDSQPADQSAWTWTAMIAQPRAVSEDLLAELREDAVKRKGILAVRRARLKHWAEGTCVQTLHVGPYCAEPRTLALIEAFIRDHGLQPRGRHHEIYLGDPRLAKPERLKTILRHQVSPG